jgi:uncharacterized membrane protein YgdD (TMEM256/DUF423 family)
MNFWLLGASVLGAVGVVLGAFGAHGLQDRLTPEQLSSWETAVTYHLFHAVLLAALAFNPGERSLGLTGVLFSAGILLFSGSIYMLVLGGPRWLGPITPLGGLALIGGWLSLAWLARS